MVLQQLSVAMCQIIANCVATVLAMIASSMCVLKGHGGGSFQFACSARTHLLSQAVKR